MKKSSTRLTLVNSVDEIPSSFVSEDEEREWWATHEFSSQLYEQLRPGWKDIEEFLPMTLRARELKQVELPLSIARKHLTQIRRAGAKRLRIPGDVRLEHALVSIVFSAAAIEAGMNLYILAPILFVNDAAQRRFFGLLSSRFATRLNIQQKLAFIKDTNPDVFENALLQAIRELFERRNALVHAAPSYSEASDQFQIVEDESQEGPQLRLEKTTDTFPSLISAGPSSVDVDQAFAFYEAAVTFLDLLRLAPPSQPESPRLKMEPLPVAEQELADKRDELV